MPKISVIVPIYNVERFFERCVYSLRNQTLQDIEIILVDDQSPDNCPKMCDEYAKQDARIRVIHKKNAGLGYARNSGIDLARGEYVAFVDSDDYVELDMFESMYNAAKEYDADFVRVDNYKEYIDGTVLNVSYIPPMRAGVYDRDELREELLFTQLGMNPSDNGSKYVSCSVWRNIYRKSIIDQFGLRFVSERQLISEDILFNIDFMMGCERAVVINKKLYHYIVNDQSLTQTYRADRFEREIELYHALIDKTKKLGIYKNCKVRLYRHLMARARKCIKNELFANPNKNQIKQQIARITKCQEMKEIYKVYPYRDLPFKHRVFYVCMKMNLFFVLSVLKNKL